MTSQEITHRFAFHPASTEEKRMDHGTIRDACLIAATVVNEKCPEGREKSLAITKLEEAMFWGNAAIARGLSE